MQRRVYDALNVFSAINIVEKRKNKIVLSEEGLTRLKECNQISIEDTAPNVSTKDTIESKSSIELCKLRVGLLHELNVDTYHLTTLITDFI